MFSCLQFTVPRTRSLLKPKCITENYVRVLWNVKPTFFDLSGYLNHSEIDEHWYTTQTMGNGNLFCLLTHISWIFLAQFGN